MRASQVDHLVGLTNWTTLFCIGEAHRVRVQSTLWRMRGRQVFRLLYFYKSCFENIILRERNFHQLIKTFQL